MMLLGTNVLNVFAALEGNTQEQANSIMVTKLMADALAEENVPSSIIYKMLMTPPTSIYWLTPDDLAAWNVNIITADESQTQPAAPQAIECLKRNQLHLKRSKCFVNRFVNADAPVKRNGFLLSKRIW